MASETTSTASDSTTEATNEGSNSVPEESPGIAKLSKMLDPSKAEERRQLIAEARERFYQDFGDLNYKVAYQSLFELLWYSQLPCFDIRNITSKEKDEMSLVKKCYWQDKEVSFEVFNLYTQR